MEISSKPVNKALFFFLVCLLASCNKNDPQVSTRSFLMGFTPMPYDFTPKAVEENYHQINTYGDLIAHHFDEGIPWNEALTGQSYSQHLQNDIALRLSNTSEDKKIYLALTPLSSRSRRELALYWGDEPNLALPAFWATKRFSDPDVILAYSNFCKYMIDRFEPDYFNYGIEVSGQWKNDEEQEFQDLLTLLESTYKELKNSYTDLPIFVSILSHPSNRELTTLGEHISISKKCLAFSDYVSVSTYPFLGQSDPIANPDLLSPEYFNELRNLAPQKPFAIAETGYIAETLTVFDGAAEVEGREQWQNDFLEMMLLSINELDTEFVVWFLIQDYDAGWLALEQAGFSDVFKVWKDTGLIDGKGNSRISLDTWKKWLEKPITN